MQIAITQTEAADFVKINICAILKTFGHDCISILPCLSNVFESLVTKQIIDHLKSNRTFSDMQSGFRAGHGCTSATLLVLIYIVTTIDRK